ncbi:MAG: extracellular catalytic domain type 1 short-chain-length polyhydroxyalkanoate depolymerase [Thermoplasmatota archaeon]
MQRGKRRRGFQAVAVVALCLLAAMASPVSVTSPTLQGNPGGKDTGDMLHPQEPDASPPTNGSRRCHPGTSLRFLVHDGRLRSYYLHLPPPGIQSQPLPLVIALHAGGSNAVDMMRTTNLSGLADRAGFAVVYPNGITRLNPWWRMWNGGYCCGVAYEKNVDDVGFIRSLVEEMSQQVAIDPQRIYVTGHSNGAIMAYRLASQLSHLVAAVAPVAGAIGGTASEDSPPYVIPPPRHPVSVIAFHGLLDENVPYHGGHGNHTWGTGTDLSVNDSISFWVQHNGCRPVPTTTVSESGNIVVDTYSGGINGTEVVLYTIVNGGHGWPGSSRGDRPTQEISATQLMWNFFTKHPRP